MSLGKPKCHSWVIGLAKDTFTWTQRRPRRSKTWGNQIQCMRLEVSQAWQTTTKGSSKGTPRYQHMWITCWRKDDHVVGYNNSRQPFANQSVCWYRHLSKSTKYEFETFGVLWKLYDLKYINGNCFELNIWSSTGLINHLIFCKVNTIYFIIMYAKTWLSWALTSDQWKGPTFIFLQNVLAFHG